ncbi:MAG: type II secretion system protein [Candidatus Sungbacteria bacterium]|nr:type II secretion system protein [Candidatus Sungbacteria bacterium]
MNFSKTSSGFTLVELLVVIGMIAVMALLVLSFTRNARTRGRDSKRMQDLLQIQRALEFYYSEYGYYPRTGGVWVYSSNSSWDVLGAALQSYMPTLPHDPRDTGGDPWVTGNYTYAYAPTGEVGVDEGFDYELITQLEDREHPNRCELKCWTSHGHVKVPWCLPCSGGQNYSPYTYSGHY